MLDANNFTFLISFRNSTIGHFIVNTQLSNNGLKELSTAINERKKSNTHHFDVYQLSNVKRKFLKIPKQKFITITSFCTELNEVLNES